MGNVFKKPFYKDKISKFFTELLKNPVFKMPLPNLIALATGVIGASIVIVVVIVFNTTNTSPVPLPVLPSTSSRLPEPTGNPFNATNASPSTPTRSLEPTGNPFNATNASPSPSPPSPSPSPPSPSPSPSPFVKTYPSWFNSLNPTKSNELKSLFDDLFNRYKNGMSQENAFIITNSIINTFSNPIVSNYYNSISVSLQNIFFTGISNIAYNIFINKKKDPNEFMNIIAEAMVIALQGTIPYTRKNSKNQFINQSISQFFSSISTNSIVATGFVTKIASDVYDSNSKTQPDANKSAIDSAKLQMGVI
jgi:hypothetical protein